MDYLWNYLVTHAADYGFLGPIVGIVGLLLGAISAIMFGWSRTLNSWKPPQEAFPDGLSKIATAVCAVGLAVVWLSAEPANGKSYLNLAVWLAIIGVVAFLIYVGLWSHCGRFRMPQVGANNKPDRTTVIWGGFWLWHDIRAQVTSNNSVDTILAGKLYDRSKVWPQGSLVASSVVTSAVLITLLASITLALSTAAAGVQVALTNKPARAVLSSKEVPGIPVDSTREDLSTNDAVK